VQIILNSAWYAKQKQYAFNKVKEVNGPNFLGANGRDFRMQSLWGQRGGNGERES
jgi:hypothetical protein